MSDDLCFTDHCGRRATARTDEGAPICSECRKVRQMRRLDGPPNPGPDDGVLHRNHIFAAGPDNAPHVGAVPVWYRPPQRIGDAHHDQPIEINGETWWQQAPPVHCRDATVLDSPREQRRRLQEISEGQAHKLSLDNELARAQERLSRAPRAEVLAVLGLSVRALERRMRKAAR